MDHRGPFDYRLEHYKEHGAPESVIDASVFVNDTLELARSSAEQVFGKDRFTPADVVAVYDRIVSRIERAKARGQL